MQATDKRDYKKNSSSKCITLLAAFLFASRRRKEKSYQKRNAEREIATSAEVEEGYAPSTAPPFEKGGRKLFIILTVLTTFVSKLINTRSNKKNACKKCTSVVQYWYHVLQKGAFHELG